MDASTGSSNSSASSASVSAVPVMSFPSERDWLDSSELLTRALTPFDSASSSGFSDEPMGDSYSSAPPSPPSELRAHTSTSRVFAWQEADDVAAAFAPTASCRSGQTAPARPAPATATRASTEPPIRSVSISTSGSASSASSTASSASPAPTPRAASLTSPAFSLQADSPRYVDTYLSLASTDMYCFFDDTTFRALYLQHIIHSAQPHPQTDSRARLLCISSVLAVGARMYGNDAYSASCAAVARHCAQSIRSELPQSAADVALAYRGLCVLSYYSAAMLDASEAEWLSVADQLLAVDGARSLIPAQLIHVLHQMPPAFVDALRLPADEVCAEVARRQTLLHSADLVKYRRCKRLLRQLNSVTVEDDEQNAAQDELSLQMHSAVTASIASCSTCKLASLHRAVWQAVADAERRPSLRFSVYDALTTALCCEAAALPTAHRYGVHAIQLGCYLLLGRRREAVQAARDTLSFYSGQLALLLPFALSFACGVAVLVDWDAGADVPAVVAGALQLLHTASVWWPAVRAAEAELLRRIHDKCRAEMRRASVRVEGQGSAAAGGKEESGESPRFDTTRLQTAMRMELALEALEMEWQSGAPTTPAGMQEVDR